MLPTSHFDPINAPLAAFAGEGEVHCLAAWQVDEHSQARRDSGIKVKMRDSSAAVLASEFSEFITAASRLEMSYRELQGQVSALGLELSERKSALKKSFAENERMRLALQQIVDSMPCGVLVLDERGEISMLNPESGRLLGLNPTQFGADSHATLQQISAMSGVDLEAPPQQAVLGETEQEFCVRDFSGKRWIEVRNRLLFHQPGRAVPDQTILILRDVTAQKRSEQERDAGRKAMALAEITTILAHEIRNPLASLELFAELIEQDGERRGEWISHLRAGIRSLSGTVNNVLSFHAAGALKLTPIRICDVIANAIEFVQPIAKQASISLECLIVRNQTLVMGNEGALGQVVLNLISNAIRHTTEGGSIAVAMRCEQMALTGEADPNGREYAVVEVSDTGCGIRRDQIEHVFEPGFSGSGDTSGLGLAVCAQIMQQHQGRITVANRTPAGTVFALYFPALELGLAKG